ncbi:hypothetical protein PYCCODRAFT_1223147 [Trametes coccinea BRFM310]|uniref:Uncharacterized protein n=1 Tax=Trametes coccinea (strain BRFM310) TaxID=1353009 RepID=A0A1Y2IXC3_TRAC3|nr:hypothetical protein PYCCODRAFT_1223147 [Trametes coccinea BRFM310]
MNGFTAHTISVQVRRALQAELASSSNFEHPSGPYTCSSSISHLLSKFISRKNTTAFTAGKDCGIVCALCTGDVLSGHQHPILPPQFIQSCICGGDTDGELCHRSARNSVIPYTASRLVSSSGPPDNLGEILQR